MAHLPTVLNCSNMDSERIWQFLNRSVRRRNINLCKTHNPQDGRKLARHAWQIIFCQCYVLKRSYICGLHLIILFVWSQILKPSPRPSSQSQHLLPPWTRSGWSKRPGQPSPPSPISEKRPQAPSPVIKSHTKANDAMWHVNSQEIHLFSSVENNALFPHCCNFAAHFTKSHHNWLHLKN